MVQANMDSWYASKGFGVDRGPTGRGNREWDCVISRAGKRVRIEEKCLRPNPVTGAVATWALTHFWVEMLQCIWSTNHKDMGWFHHTRCDALLWVLSNKNAEPACIYWVDWRPFVAWFKGYVEEKKLTMLPCATDDHPPPNALRQRMVTKGYGCTWNITVRWDDIPPELYERYIIQDAPSVPRDPRQSDMFAA